MHHYLPLTRSLPLFLTGKTAPTRVACVRYSLASQCPLNASTQFRAPLSSAGCTKPAVAAAASYSSPLLTICPSLPPPRYKAPSPKVRPPWAIDWRACLPWFPVTNLGSRRNSVRRSLAVMSWFVGGAWIVHVLGWQWMSTTAGLFLTRWVLRISRIHNIAMHEH